MVILSQKAVDNEIDKHDPYSIDISDYEITNQNVLIFDL